MSRRYAFLTDAEALETASNRRARQAISGTLCCDPQFSQFCSSCSGGGGGGGGGGGWLCDQSLNTFNAVSFQDIYPTTAGVSNLGSKERPFANIYATNAFFKDLKVSDNTVTFTDKDSSNNEYDVARLSYSPADGHMHLKNVNAPSDGLSHADAQVALTYKTGSGYYGLMLGSNSGQEIIPTNYVLDVSGDTNLRGALIHDGDVSFNGGFRVTTGPVSFPAGSISSSAISGGIANGPALFTLATPNSSTISFPLSNIVNKTTNDSTIA
jgi:hypothetical protein